MTWEDISFLQKPWIKKGSWILANLLTFLSVCLAIIGIIFTFITPNPEQYVFWFAKILAVCSIFDFADGKLARISGSKKLAVDVDTIVDAIAFGLFPAIYLGFLVSKWEIQLSLSILAAVATALVYAGSVWYRLYRFLKRDPFYTPYFDGLPSPFAAMVVACLVIFPGTQEWVIMVSSIIVSGFMVSKIPLPSFKGVPSIFDLYWIITTTIFVVLFAAFPFEWMVYPTYAIAVYMIVYLIFGPGYAIKLEKEMKEKIK